MNSYENYLPITGDFAEFEEDLKKLGGYINRRLTDENGNRFTGYTFSKERHTETVALYFRQKGIEPTYKVRNQAIIFRRPREVREVVKVELVEKKKTPAPKVSIKKVAQENKKTKNKTKRG